MEGGSRFERHRNLSRKRTRSRVPISEKWPARSSRLNSWQLCISLERKWVTFNAFRPLTAKLEQVNGLLNCWRKNYTVWFSLPSLGTDPFHNPLYNNLWHFSYNNQLYPLYNNLWHFSYNNQLYPLYNLWHFSYNNQL